MYNFFGQHPLRIADGQADSCLAPMLVSVLPWWHQHISVVTVLQKSSLQNQVWILLQKECALKPKRHTWRIVVVWDNMYTESLNVQCVHTSKSHSVPNSFMEQSLRGIFVHHKVQKVCLWVYCYSTVSCVQRTRLIKCSQKDTWFMHFSLYYSASSVTCLYIL